MTTPTSTRNLSGLIALSCLAGMLFAMYLQYYQHLEPCPLCITQRLFITLTGITGLIAWIHNPLIIGRKRYALAGVLFGVLGASFSGRQVWLQQLPPDQVPSCGPSFQYMLETFPLSETLEIMLTGDGNCAEVNWTLLGMSIPTWVLAMFTGLIIANLYIALSRR
jgi:disulfide bond formation protein DsbB